RGGGVLSCGFRPEEILACAEENRSRGDPAEALARALPLRRGMRKVCSLEHVLRVGLRRSVQLPRRSEALAAVLAANTVGLLEEGRALPRAIGGLLRGAARCRESRRRRREQDEGHEQLAGPVRLALAARSREGRTTRSAR